MRTRSAGILFSFLLCFTLTVSSALGQTGSTRKSQAGAGAPSNGLQDETRKESAAPGVETETYEGHLVSGDVSFKLHLFEGSRATAEWVRDPGKTQKYAGSYSGSDGNYAIQLKGEAPEKNLDLTLRSTGGMVKASYIRGIDPRRDVSELKLMGVSTPNVKLKGSSAGRNNASARSRQSGTRTNTRNMRNNVGRLIRLRGNTRRGRVVIPGARRSNRR